ncbi:MAG: HEAT repeat domain-containing protein [Planctomycetota bacterium]|jgi:HEAT repeat protein/type 1 glutamine amidotransferase
MNRCVKVLIASFVVVMSFILVGETLAQQPSTPSLKALIVNGQNNHNWERSSPVLKRILRQSGLFTVDIATSPPKGGDMRNFDPNFAAYDVIVLDYTGDAWPEKTKAAFLKYVASGCGVVVYHAASNAFPDWKEFNRIAGLGGWGGRNEKHGPYVHWQDGKIVRDTSPGRGGEHGSQHEFQIVTRDKEHDITKGLPEKWMHAKDELYAKLRGPAMRLTVLATAYSAPEQRGTGRHEPVLFTVRYRRGRIFHTALGHVGGGDAPKPAVECVGFIVTFQRGAEWAATGKVTQRVPVQFPSASHVRTWKGGRPPSLEGVMAKVARYDYGQSREPLSDLTDIIRNAYDSPSELKSIEKRLLEVFDSKATSAAKQFICRQLSIIGTEKSVPGLAAMLTDPETSDMARYALERIPGSAVDQALRDTLDNTSGKVKIGIINSLGQRADEKSIRKLGRLFTDDDKQIAVAAMSAVGRIGGGRAILALERAKSKVAEDLYSVWADAYLMCADKALAQRNIRRALQVYRRLYVPAESVPIRIAALRGIIAAIPQQGADHIIDVLKSDDRQMQSMVVGLLRDIPGTDMTRAIAAELPNLSVSGQVQLLSALGNRGDQAALPAVLDAVKSPETDVRVAALGALGLLGNASAVDLLAKTAATVTGPEREAARRSLYRLGAPGTDRKILAGIPQADPKVKVELIRSVGERNVTAGVDTLAKTAQDSEGKVRLESLKVLKTIAEPKHVPALINLLLKVQTDAERREAENMVAAVARKLGQENQRAKPVLSALSAVTDVKGRSSLLAVLGKIGDAAALPVLRKALKDKNAQVQDAAVRALADWPDPSLIDDMRQIARSSQNEIHRALALRGFVRLIGLDSGRSPEEKTAMYKEAMQLAPNENEKKAVLSGLANIGTLGALQMAADYLGNENLQQEAEVAVVRIAEGTLGSHPQQTKAVLQKVIQTSQNDSRRRQAAGLLEKVQAFEDYVTAWQVSGPYTKEGAGAFELFDAAFPPETDPQSAKWTAMPVGTDKGRPWLLDLYKAIGGGDRVAYLRTNVSSPTDQKVRLQLGSNDGIKVWLNGKVVHANNASRTITRDEDKVEVNLRKGWNSLMMKITQSGGTWSACACFRTLKGDPVKGLKVLPDLKSQGKPWIRPVGDDFSAWRNPGDWTIAGQAMLNPENEELIASKPGTGIIVNGPTGRTVDLITKAELADIRAHIEFMVAQGSNSGVYFMGRYEIQILDSHGKDKPTFSDCGGIYQRWDEKRDPHGYEGRPPRVNAALPAGQWQTFDVIFRAPRFDQAGKKIANARFEKVIHNGIMVHENMEVTGPTRASTYKDEKPTGPLMLQGDHGPVAYRNIWLIPLKTSEL